MPFPSWQWVILGTVIGIALFSCAAFVSYYSAIMLPAEHSAAEERRTNALEAQVRAKVCPRASASTSVALQKFCAA